MSVRLIALAVITSMAMAACAPSVDPMESDAEVVRIEDTAAPPTLSELTPTSPPTATLSPTATSAPTGPTNTPSPEGFAANDIATDVIGALGSSSQPPWQACPPADQPPAITAGGLLDPTACVTAAGLAPGGSFTVTVTAPDGTTYEAPLTISQAGGPVYPVEGITRGWFTEPDVLTLQFETHPSLPPGGAFEVTVQTPAVTLSAEVPYGPGIQTSDAPFDPFIAPETPVVAPGEALTITGARYPPNTEVDIGVYSLVNEAIDTRRYATIAAGRALTDGDGAFSLPFYPRRDQNGERYIVRAVTPGGDVPPTRPTGSAAETDFIVVGQVSVLDFSPEGQPPVLDTLPFSTDITGGGRLSLAMVAAGCPGFGTNMPHFAFEWATDEAGGALTFTFQPTAAQPVQLLVIGPDDTAACTAEVAAQPGLYRVWVGTPNGENVAGTLTIILQE